MLPNAGAFFFMAAGALAAEGCLLLLHVLLARAAARSLTDSGSLLEAAGGRRTSGALADLKEPGAERLCELFVDARVVDQSST